MDQVARIIWDVAKCLCGRANEEAAYMNDLEENLKSLIDKGEELQGLREDVQRKVDEAENARGEERMKAVDGWMKKVDAFQKELENIQVQGDREVQNKCLSKCCPINCMFGHRLGKDVDMMLTKVNELISMGVKFMGKDVEIAHKLLPRHIKMLFGESTPIGLDRMCAKVWKSIEEENVGIIGLYGMGGVGKTTLLKIINNKLGAERLDFDVVIWVVVSKYINFDGIMDHIRQMVGVDDKCWNCCGTSEQKVAKIYEVLKEKKFVLLLDDMWQTLDLSKVGVPYPEDTNFQSKVLFTTRIEDVCAKMHAERTFKVEILTEKEALELFHMKVTEKILKLHPDIRKIAKEIAKECKGLPLALIVLGSAMAGITSVEAWKYARNHLMSSASTAPELEKVFSILEFSYNRLPDETHKECLLYCALYPEDYEIPVLDLIDKWMGEGFLVKDATESIQDISNYGESVIEKLKQSCLLESVEGDLFMSRTVKLHDVIRDLALWIARDQDRKKEKILVGDALAVSRDDVEAWKIVERISIMQHGKLHSPIVPCPNLMTFKLSTPSSLSIEEFRNLDLPNVHYMTRLKVLDLSFDDNNFMKLPEGIGCLDLLEYLSLRGRMNHYQFPPFQFPIGLKNLKNLKIFTLDVMGGRSPSVIPLKAISNFKQLRVFKFVCLHFDRSKTAKEKKFLEKLESLPKLERLWISIGTKSCLNKLLKSTKLQSFIYGLVFLDIPINMPSLLASLSKMKHLQVIRFVRLKMEDSSPFDTCCLSMLREVVIGSCKIDHLTWLKYAPLLQNIKIDQCESLEEVIKGGIEDRGNADNIFSSLVQLEFWLLPKLRSIYTNALPFSSLKIVKIYYCPNLKKLPFDTNTSAEKLMEIRGEENWWNQLEWEDPTIRHKFHSVFQPI